MPAAKKAKRKSKPPAKLKEFLCEENIDKELGPRRSRRTPKISVKLKRYMDDQGGVVKEQDGSSSSTSHMTKDPQITLLSGLHLLGSQYREPKVILKALPNSMLQKGIRKFPANKRDVRVILKRLGNRTSKKHNKIYTSKLHKQKSVLTRSVSPPSSTRPRRELRVELEDISSITKPSQNQRGRKKRTSLRQEPQIDKKQTRNPRATTQKIQDEKTNEKTDSRFDPDVMNKLFNFGAKVEEVLTLNKEAIDQLTRNNDRVQSFSEIFSDDVRGIDENDVLKILNWLEEEEHQRREHRQRVLESLRESHRTNIALYSHMLTVLQAVTASG